MFANLNSYGWSDIKKLDRDHLAYVLPISSNEQHGRALPVGTDDFILQTSLDAFEKSDPPLKNTFLRLPAIHYGNSFEHIDFDGTITLKASTIIAIIEDIMGCMVQHHVRYLVIVNSHGGNAPIFQAMAQEWTQRFGIRIFNINYFGSDFFANAQHIFDTNINQDIHGGEIEVSYLSYALPKVVHMDRLDSEKDVFVNLHDYDPGWLSRDLSPNNGLIGGASHSTVEKGERIFRYVQNKLASYFHIFDEIMG